MHVQLEVLPVSFYCWWDCWWMLIWWDCCWWDCVSHFICCWVSSLAEKFSLPPEPDLACKLCWYFQVEWGRSWSKFVSRLFIWTSSLYLSHLSVNFSSISLLSNNIMSWLARMRYNWIFFLFRRIRGSITHWTSTLLLEVISITRRPPLSSSSRIWSQ